MSDSPAVIDLLFRGMHAGVSILLAAAFISRRPWSWRRALGALFILGATAYVLGSSHAISDALGPFIFPVRILSIYAPVFFWWFALTLFDDGFRWRWIFAAPLALETPLLIAYYFFREDGWLPGALALAHMTMAVLYAHAIYVALRSFNDDLIEGRRRFRIVFAIAVAVTGLIITYFETVGVDPAAANGLKLFQATAIFFLTLGFGVWLIAARPEVIDGGAPPVREPGAAPPSPPASPVRAADQAAYMKLTALMDGGAWREEGLTVAALAAKVGLAEHQLRRLINQELGFRNFSAFLGARRIEAAKAALADPAQARKQILQIALDLGYGSIAPFNRAFKEATGKTPTEFRRAGLGEG